MPKKKLSESLPELIARLRTERILPILALIDAEQEGLITLPEDYSTVVSSSGSEGRACTISLRRVTD